jgi:hypothetical protein
MVLHSCVQMLRERRRVCANALITGHVLQLEDYEYGALTSVESRE